MTIELALLRAARPEIDPSQAALAQRLERLERARAGGRGRLRRHPAPPPASRRSRRPSPIPAPAAEPPVASRLSPRRRAEDPAASPADQSPVEAIAQGAVATAEQVRSQGRGGPHRGRERGRGVRRRRPAAPVDVERSISAALAGDRRPGQAVGLGVPVGGLPAARPVAVDAERSTVEIGFPPNAAFNKRKAEGKENRERFSEAVRTIVGTRLSPSYVLLDEEQAEPAEPAGTDAAERLDESELIERLKAEFDAEELIEHPGIRATTTDDAEEAEG